MTYVLLHVGCLECSNTTEVLGVWPDEEVGVAMTALETHAKKYNTAVGPLSPVDYPENVTTVAVVGARGRIGGSGQLQLHRWRGGNPVEQ